MHIDLASKASSFRTGYLREALVSKCGKEAHTDLAILSYELSPLDKDRSNSEQSQTLMLQD